MLELDGWETAATIGSILLFAFLVALFAVAATSIGRTSQLSSVTKAAWIVACFAVPLLGPGLWLLYGRADAVAWDARQR